MTAVQNQEIAIPGFGGGQVSAKGVSTYATNEFAAMNNIIVRAGGNGFRSREGNSVYATVSSSPVTGLGYLKTAAGNEYIVAVAGSSIFKDTNFTGTFTDITGSVTVTAGQNNLWTFFQSNALLIGVTNGGDAPIKYTGTGNVALLGGSPPAGNYGFAYANRTFILGSQANPSRVNWSVLANPEDWTSDGSGSSDIEPDDGDVLVTAAPINLNTIIFFKKNSIHLMTGRSSPFPVFPLFDGVGCVGKNACVVYQGQAYFITPDARMLVTDGNSIVPLAHLPDMQDVWKSFRSFRLPYIQGTVVNGIDFDWIVWSCTLSRTSTNDYAAIWDLRNQCWLTCSSGFESNAFTTTLGKVLYMGGYDGKIYQQFAANTYTDASNSSTAVSWQLESDWLVLSNVSTAFSTSTAATLLSVKQINRVNILHQTRATGTLVFSYGYDYNQTLKNTNLSVATSNGALWDTAQWDSSVWDGYNGKIQNPLVLGRGNAFKWKLSGSSAISYDVSKVSLFGKSKTRKVFNAI